MIDSVSGVGPGLPVSVRVADGRIHATTTSTDQLEETDGPAEEDD